MSVNVNYCDTFLNALKNAYTAGDYVRTFGFASVGDGGAAVYEYIVEPDEPTDYGDTVVHYKDHALGDGRRYCFRMLPQNGIVYAEQFGVFPGDVAFAADNIKMLNRAVAYAAKNACVLTFASKGTYYVNPSSIIVPSGMRIDGNGATLQICEGSANSVGLFNSSTLVNNVSISNLNLVGRRTSASGSKDDQAIHIKCNNLNVKNVRFKCFNYALHTYGGDYVGTYIIQAADEADTKTYMIPEIPNKNWLIENCTVSDVVMGVSFSEIDGLVIKDSEISCFMDGTKNNHCVYLSSNCSNVRVSNTLLHDVPGDAIHKAYSSPASNPKFDKSKNHFFTDLSIHNADSALDIGIISQNVMCDNVFATEVKVILQLIGADNCIVSNSYFGPADNSSKSTTFIYAEDTCNCWVQNSYVKYNGSHRVASSDSPSAYIKDMYSGKKHRRMYIGQNFDIPNHWLKFTGCEFESTYALNSCYYEEVFGDGYYSPPKSQYGEYLDNCSITIKTSSEMFRLLPVNDLLGGITYRNCYLKNISDSKNQPPFIMWCKYPALSDVSPCESNTCPVNPSFACALYATGKKYPWIRFENNIFDNFMYPVNNISWYLLLKEGKPKDTTYNAPQRSLVPNYLNAYLSNGYKLNGNVFSSILNLMKN